MASGQAGKTCMCISAPDKMKVFDVTNPLSLFVRIRVHVYNLILSAQNHCCMLVVGDLEACTRSCYSDRACALIDL